jgi:fermentation-respiration switch protein FrsA (DUF1100 family)
MQSINRWRFLARFKPGVKPFARFSKVMLLLEVLMFGCLWLLFSPAFATPFYEELLFFPDKHDYASQMKLPLQQIKDKLHMTAAPVWFKNSEGRRLNGLFFKRDGAKRTIIVCHGNAGNVAHRTPLVAALGIGDSDSNVMLFDYQGFGKSEGQPSIPGVVKDGLAAYDYVVNERHCQPTDVIMYGESLGCAVAAQVSSQRQLAGVILQSPFSSLYDAGRSRFFFVNWYPESWFANINLDNVAVFKKPHPPLLLIHGTADNILGVNNSEKIFASAIGPKQLAIIPGMGHCLDDIKCKPYDAALTTFIHSLSHDNASKS